MPRPKTDPNTLRVAPAIREFFEVVHEDARSYELIASQAGVCKSTIIRWMHSTSPNLDTFTAAANALGYDVTLTPASGGEITLAARATSSLK